MGKTADVVICGAGIAGISAAFHLAARHGVKGVLLVDERPPLTLTSDKSTECYRNWWPGPDDAMIRFMERSIDLLDELARESGDFFHLNRRGYAFLTAEPERARLYESSARESSRLGAGPLRIHRSNDRGSEVAEDSSTGADLYLDGGAILERYPFLAGDVTAMLHPRRCGWLDAQQLGMYLLERAREAGVALVRARVEDVAVRRGRVEGVRLSGDAGAIATGCFVNAAGPLVSQVGELLGVELPVWNEFHAVASLADPLAVVPRELPLMIWSDPVRLAWTEEERRGLAADEEMRWLLGEMPAGVHFRTEGGPESDRLLVLWTYDHEPREPVVPPVYDPLYPLVALRGLARMIPGLAVYFDDLREPFVEGGYYCKTRENRPLVGPLPVAGGYVLGALSGFGIMASQAAAELLAAHVTGTELPPYAAAFSLERYDDPAYRSLLERLDATAGQL